MSVMESNASADRVKVRWALAYPFDVPDSDPTTSYKARHPLTKDEEEYIAKCMAKHGDDFGKIFRDIKVNNLQHTETKLRKLGARYLLLTEEQRRVDVPENILHLLPTDQNRS